MDFEYIAHEEEYSLRLDKKGDIYEATLGDKVLQLDAIHINDNTVHFIMNNKSYVAYVGTNEEHVHVSLNGKQFHFTDAYLEDKSSVSIEEVVEGKQVITAPMPGSVVKINVAEGDTVTKDQNIIVVEAMKMENELRAKLNGIVTAIHVKEAQQVDTSQPLVEIEEES